LRKVIVPETDLRVRLHSLHPLVRYEFFPQLSFSPQVVVGIVNMLSDLGFVF
jgi:hypothetical protein